ncbi:hypothetical protein BAUCODRAFT_35790 [Baudoinia panamericana UAMH 10762]|uniref:NADP-dependent oxidoreductase domain-containing protein n=1 Tax=Baudoinia panamericana (strain UAMH 10762) TaxID=717646 RepID=M2MDG0_BAUPA|nr:uncharacterized protein BAUCODRAFT_35790 [Baudoinia panamericana UAMH 10762]EMC94556.1 hypothetical protein BAUCODRAFT_35790 [Baudoinia panamericana UAMH 10762]
MVKIIVGLMGSSASSGSASMNGANQLRPFLNMLKQHGVRELDTARVYNKGKSEEDLGGIAEAKTQFMIATKAPGYGPDTLSYQNVIDNCNASLKALKQDKIELYYFHGPDRKTPLEESCRAISQLHRDGKIDRFAISGFNVQEVEDIHAICTRNSWIAPSVYQGIYNPLARAAEQSLIPTVHKFNMAYYAWSPLAGGFFAKSAEQLRTPAAGGRFDQMKHFSSMFVNDVSLALHDDLTKASEAEGLSVKEATLRWLMHHSALGKEDGVILGGSSIEQMEQNLRACEGGPLPESVVQSFANMWTKWQEAGKALPASS